jgi:membrane protein YqaA with SNARE-associated domain
MITDLLGGHLGLLIACFLINMLPFGPSNMVLAGIAALILPHLDFISIGVIVAAAATSAKFMHYWTVRGSRQIMSDERLSSLEKERERVEKWGALALFLAAASPFPDDPIIVYVGLTKYNVVKFLVSYFIGKVAVTLAGAYIGHEIGSYFEPLPVVIGSIALTLIITYYLVRKRSNNDDA